MAWIVLTVAHFAERLSVPELEASGSHALADEQPDPVAPALAAVTQEVRGYVAAHPANSLGAGETIPSELLNAAMALVIPQLCTRLPLRMTDARAEAKRDALTLLRHVAEGKFYVGSAAEQADEQPGGIELASGDGAVPSSVSLDGLI